MRLLEGVKRKRGRVRVIMFVFLFGKFLALFCLFFNQGPAKGGGFKRGVFPILDLSFLFCPFLSFLGLSRFFWDFPDFLGDGPGIFPICFSRPIKSTYEEQPPKGSATQSGPFSKKVGNTRVWNPPGLASLNSRGPNTWPVQRLTQNSKKTGFQRTLCVVPF